MDLVPESLARCTSMEAASIAHQDKDVICHVLRGKGRLRIATTTRVLVAEDVCRVPAGIPHDISTLEEPLVLFYVSISVPEPGA